MTKKHLIKRFGYCLALFGFMLVMSFNLCLAAEDEEMLTITGDGIQAPVTFTRSQLETMQNEIIQYTYSSKNNWPSHKKLASKGIPLRTVLEKAGLKPEAKLITVKAFDGYNQVFTRQELLDDERYYFPKSDENTATGAQQVETIIALESGDTLDDLESDYLKLCLGQRSIQEQTYPWFVKYVDTIEVSTVLPEKCALPVAEPVSGGVLDGTEVILNHPELDKVKIYYTTDGSEPGINSTMYNVSATYYQPDLNKAIVINNDITIKAIAIGPGKLNSDVAAFEYRIVKEGTGNTGFADIGNYEWARTSIEDLAKRGVINGMGDGKFAPGEPLTRAQFAKIMVVALYGEPQGVNASHFTDVKEGQWYSNYVTKAAQEGLINGFEDGTFGANQALTKEQMIAIIVRAMGKDIEAQGLNGAGLLDYADKSTISSWALGYIECAEKEGLLEHGHMVTPASFQKWQLMGQQTAKRAEAAETVYRMLNKR